MIDFKIGSAGAHFADLIWENEPITSSQLAMLGEEKFDWKKTTSFTVLKRLCDRGMFQNHNGVVTSLISREEFYARHSEQYVEDTFAGSLPAFIAAFTQNSRLTSKEAEAIRRMIDEAEEK